MRSLRWLIMSWVFLCGVIGSGLVGPNRMAVREQYALSETAFGAGFAVTQIVSSSLVLLMAHWLVRLCSVSILRLALVMVTLGFSIISFSNGVIALIVGWAFTTAGMTMGMITNNISMDLWPADPRRGIVLLHSFNAGGKMAGPLVVAIFLGIGYRWSFSAVGIVTLLVLVASVLLRSHINAVHTREMADPGFGLSVLKKPAFWSFMVMVGMIAGGEVAFATLLPTYLVTERAMTPGVANVLLTVHLAGLTIGRFVSASLGDRVSPTTVIWICLTAGLCVFPAILIASLPVIVISLLVMGVMFSSTWPSYYALAAGRMPQMRQMMPYGSALGCFLMASVCVVISSMIADCNLRLSMFFGPAVMGLFGLLHLVDDIRYKYRLSATGQVETVSE